MQLPVTQSYSSATFCTLTDFSIWLVSRCFLLGSVLSFDWRTRYILHLLVYIAYVVFSLSNSNATLGRFRFCFFSLLVESLTAASVICAYNILFLPSSAETLGASSFLVFEFNFFTFTDEIFIQPHRGAYGFHFKCDSQINWRNMQWNSWLKPWQSF